MRDKRQTDQEHRLTIESDETKAAGTVIRQDNPQERRKAINDGFVNNP